MVTWTRSRRPYRTATKTSKGRVATLPAYSGEMTGSGSEHEGPAGAAPAGADAGAAPVDAPVRLKLSASLAGTLIAASFAVPALAALVRTVAAPGILWYPLGALAAVGFGLRTASAWWDRPWLLEVDRTQLRLRSLRRIRSLPIEALTGVVMVRATRWESHKNGSVDVPEWHLYLTFRLPPAAGRQGDSLPNLTRDPARDPDPSDEVRAAKALAGSDSLTVRVSPLRDDGGTFVEQLSRLAPGVEVERSPLAPHRVRGGWSESYVPPGERSGPGEPSEPVVLCALENASRLHPDHDLRELRGVIAAVLGLLVWLGAAFSGYDALT